MYALVNPVLALGLLAVAGLLAARLPRPSSTRPPSLDLALTAGAPLVLLGLVLGPGIELLARPLWRALRVALRASHPARHLAACGSGSGGRLPRRGAVRLAARPACTEPRGGVGAAPPHRARPRGGRRGVGARGGHGGGPCRRRGAPPRPRPGPP